MSTPTPQPPNPNGPDPSGNDPLDAMLREWHQVHADKAAAGRDRLLAALANEASPTQVIEPKVSQDTHARSVIAVIRRVVMNRYSPLAAAAIAFAVLLPFILPTQTKLIQVAKAGATTTVMAPEGGRLDAFDDRGNLLGPCELKHTDVKAEISGRFTRVTLTQKYHNPHADTIEATYTFPLSSKAGVDRMTMTVGDRMIVGEVKERQAARRIYEAARGAGRVASLLEQERPNIFTQSVANIQPGATIDIEISYVEFVTERDGVFQFDFPTVVGPRYIPGGSGTIAPPTPQAGDDHLAERTHGPIPRRGVVLVAPARVRVTGRGDGLSRSEVSPDARLLNSAIAAARPVAAPADAESNTTYFELEAEYADGSREPGRYRLDGYGEVAGRWFYCPPPEPPAVRSPTAEPGAPFAQPTDQVPDADKITPMPTRPNTRAGHDISISVTLDTGGPGILSLDSPLHRITRTNLATDEQGRPRRVALALEQLNEIPNKDFVLKWTQTDDTITDRVFAHSVGTGTQGTDGGFVAIQLEPPARVDDEQAVPRELVFVVDTSGSMNGPPIQTCKTLMRQAIESMRPLDRFNLITFAGHTQVLWPELRPNTPNNRAEALRLLERQNGSGGTEMMKAIDAALSQPTTGGRPRTFTPAQLADLPADGRTVVVRVTDGLLSYDGLEVNGKTINPKLVVREGLAIRCGPFDMPHEYLDKSPKRNVDLAYALTGGWVTENGERVFKVQRAMMDQADVRPLRIVMFLTDAYVGNDFAIIDAIKRNRQTTRVFSFGVGNSVNRWLIEEMARAGGGEPEFVYIGQTTEQDIAAGVERFNRRTRTPVLTDIQVTFNGVTPTDLVPDLSNIPDLFDQRPLTILGRYQGGGTGSVTIRGQTGRGPWERTIPLNLPAASADHSSLPTLWARAKIDVLMGMDLVGIQTNRPNPDLKAQIVSLGEQFNVMSQYTSFVAVDTLRVTVGGKPRRVYIPIELPDKTNWEGFFGPPGDARGRRDEMPAAEADAARDMDTLQIAPEVLKGLSEQLKQTRETERSMREAANLLEDRLATTGERPRSVDHRVTKAAAPAASPRDPAGVVGGASADPGAAYSGAPPTPPAPAMPPPGLAVPMRAQAAASAPNELSKKVESARFRGSGAADSQANGSASEFAKEKTTYNRSLSRRELTTSSLGMLAPQRDTDDESLRDDAVVTPGESLLPTRGWLALLAATELASTDTDGAKQLACSATQLAPGGVPADQLPSLMSDFNTLCTLLNDANAGAEVRAVKLAELKAKAKAALLEQRRESIVRRTLADSLLARLSGPSATATDERIAVVVLLSDTKPETLERLKKLGVTIESVHAEAMVVIAKVNLSKLRAVGLMDQVRRVEPLPE